jgi:hypothetical protein
MTSNHTTIDTNNRSFDRKSNGADKSNVRSKFPLRLRRSFSAPPSTKRRLIEEHYRLDETKSVVLPGLPKHEDDWPRDAHDFFNLVVLVRDPFNFKSGIFGSIIITKYVFTFFAYYRFL